MYILQKGQTSYIQLFHQRYTFCKRGEHLTSNSFTRDVHSAKGAHILHSTVFNQRCFIQHKAMTSYVKLFHWRCLFCAKWGHLTFNCSTMQQCIFWANPGHLTFNCFHRQCGFPCITLLFSELCMNLLKYGIYSEISIHKEWGFCMHVQMHQVCSRQSGMPKTLPHDSCHSDHSPEPNFIFYFSTLNWWHINPEDTWQSPLWVDLVAVK